MPCGSAGSSSRKRATDGLGQTDPPAACGRRGPPRLSRPQLDLGIGRSGPVHARRRRPRGRRNEPAASHRLCLERRPAGPPRLVVARLRASPQHVGQGGRARVLPRHDPRPRPRSSDAGGGRAHGNGPVAGFDNCRRPVTASGCFGCRNDPTDEDLQRVTVTTDSFGAFDACSLHNEHL